MKTLIFLIYFLAILIICKALQANDNPRTEIYSDGEMYYLVSLTDSSVIDYNYEIDSLKIE
jgi:hypothetical protein